MSYPAQRVFHVAKTVFVAPYGVTTVATNPTAHGIDPAQAKIKPHVRFFVIIRAIEGASRQPRRSGSAFAIAAQHFRASIGDIASQHNAGCCGARGVGVWAWGNSGGSGSTTGGRQEPADPANFCHCVTVMEAQRQSRTSGATRLTVGGFIVEG